MDITTEEYTLLFNTITETIQRLESIKSQSDLCSAAGRRACDQQGRIKRKKAAKPGVIVARALPSYKGEGHHAFSL